MTIKYLDAKRIRGLSSDTKPTNVPENTLFDETDTYKTYWLQSDATWMEQNPPMTYMVMMGGASGKADDIQRITIATSGNSVDFGEMNNGVEKPAGVSNNTRGCACGGEAPSEINDIQYVTIGTLGNATDFGNLTTTCQRAGGVSDVSNDKGIVAGGIRSNYSNVIDYFAIASTGNASDFGDLTQARGWIAECWSETRGVFCNGYVSTDVDTMDYITMATAGNATDFGDTTQSRYSSDGTTNLTRGVICGGYKEESTASALDIIDYITIDTTGNATDFGDLMEAQQNSFAGSDLTDKAVIGGGSGNQDRIQTFTISTTGNATNFGSMVNDKHDGCTVNGS